ALALGGAFVMVRLREPSGAWYFLIAYYLWSAAASAFDQERAHDAVTGTRVRQLMRADLHPVDAGATLSSLVRDVMLPFNLRAVPVLDRRMYAGVVTIADLRGVEQERWAEVRVAEVMRPREAGPALRPENHLAVALDRFGATETPLLPVIEGGELVGVLDRDALEGFVRLREALRPS
ncbi:MAG: CBS domain-containing protein, partial [Chloroflexi bacterium]|nr:CBS domain-containing protein [Chloroflexota bacterium]